MNLTSRSQKRIQKENNYFGDRSESKERIFAYINGSLEVKDHGTHHDHWEKEKLNKTFRGVYNTDSNTVRVIAPRMDTNDYSNYTSDDIPNRVMCKIYDHFGVDINLLVY